MASAFSAQQILQTITAQESLSRSFDQIFGSAAKARVEMDFVRETANKLGVENLVLYHTEDKNLPRRKELYTREGREYFAGGLYIPDDLERIQL